MNKNLVIICITKPKIGTPWAYFYTAIYIEIISDLWSIYKAEFNNCPKKKLSLCFFKRYSQCICQSKRFEEKNSKNLIKETLDFVNDYYYDFFVEEIDDYEIWNK